MEVSVGCVPFITRGDVTVHLSHELVRDYEGEQVLAIAPYKSEFIKLLWPGTDPKSKKSFAGSNMLAYFKKLRNEAAGLIKKDDEKADQLDDLFGAPGEAEAEEEGEKEPPKKKKARGQQKRKAQELERVTDPFVTINFSDTQIKLVNPRAAESYLELPLND